MKSLELREKYKAIFSGDDDSHNNYIIGLENSIKVGLNAKWEKQLENVPIVFFKEESMDEELRKLIFKQENDEISLLNSKTYYHESFRKL